MTRLDGDNLWYKDAVIYELHVRAFSDSNGDGIGDFRGLTDKLDYLQDLGVTAIWLLPFYPSPLKDDGYDIADYTNVHPAYGTLRDFRTFLREAHRRGLRVITELVLNHTSDQHPWFQRARRAPAGSPWRDFYVWSDTPSKYKEARIIFKDFEHSNWTYDPVAKQYYWHRFYSHQPDLNFDNPAVRQQMFEILDFWLEMGVDGLRLDAVPYLFEREGTSCENLPETHDYLKELRAHVDKHFGQRMLLAEANQWPEDAVAYLDRECHMAFHFPVMPRMFMAVRMEDRFPIIDILQQTPEVEESAQWALFLRNHDELTLEMVTDEERDYMYRMYAHDPQMRINLGIRRRLAPLLGNNRRLIELMNGLLFSLPGTPVIYYGDELGMGENIYLGDRNGVRTPMQWSADRNAGFSRANPQRLYLPVIIDPEYHAEALNVEAQQGNAHSMLWWMKRMIALRKAFKAFGRGKVEFLYPDNRKVLAMIRSFEDERILIVANLSRYAQAVELDMSAYEGMHPVELFGRTEFPPIGALPYFVTLGPHAFYWFSLERERIELSTKPRERIPALDVVSLDGLPRDALHGLEPLLPGFLMSRRWFGGKSRRMKSTTVSDIIDIPSTPPSAVVAVGVEYHEGDPETYMLPVTVARGEAAAIAERHKPETVVARLRCGDDEALLVDATNDHGFARTLLDGVGRRRRFRGEHGEITATPTRAFRRLVQGGATEPWVMRAEQSNTSIAYGEQLVLKVFRRIEEGTNPDLEIGHFLTDGQRFAHTAEVAGWLEYRGNGMGQAATAGILQRFVSNEGDAWSYTLDMLSSYIDRAIAHTDVVEEIREGEGIHLLDLCRKSPPQFAEDAIGPYLESARLLGERTAQLHSALASELDDPAFAPEPFTPFYQRSLYQTVRTLAREVFTVLRSKHALPEAAPVLDLEDALMARFGALVADPIDAQRIRIHGDYHLGQVLYTGKDFAIIDFEGEPARPLSARKIKRSPLSDVAGMLRSFHYAAYGALRQRPGDLAPRDPNELERWILFWYRWVAASFLRSYLDTAAPSNLLPGDPAQLRLLLDVLLLEKAVYEIGYEANNRPDWLRIPIEGVMQLLEASG